MKLRNLTVLLLATMITLLITGCQQKVEEEVRAVPEIPSIQGPSSAPSVLGPSSGPPVPEAVTVQEDVIYTLPDGPPSASPTASPS